MSHYNPRTGRYADDFQYRLVTSEATVKDLVEHSREILVEAPEVWGTVVTEPVRLLLAVISQLNHGLDVPLDMSIRDLEAELGMRVVEFDRPFHVSYEEGMVSVGHITIDTEGDTYDDEAEDPEDDPWS